MFPTQCIHQGIRIACTIYHELSEHPLSLFTAITVVFYAWNATGLVARLCLFLLALLTIMAAGKCDLLAQAYFAYKFRETATVKNVLYCIAAQSVTWITAVLKGGVVGSKKCPIVK